MRTEWCGRWGRKIVWLEGKEKKREGERQGERKREGKKKKKKRYYERRNGRPRTLLHLVKLQSFLGYIRDTRCAW